MPKIFGIDVQKIVAKNIGPGVFPVTLASVTQGVRTSGQLTQGSNPTEVSYEGRGFVDKFSDYQMAGTSVKASDRKIVLIWGTFPADTPDPKPGDKLLSESTTYVIVKDGVMRDPASATFTCQGRK